MRVHLGSADDRLFASAHHVAVADRATSICSAVGDHQKGRVPRLRHARTVPNPYDRLGAYKARAMSGRGAHLIMRPGPPTPAVRVAANGSVYLAAQPVVR